VHSPAPRKDGINVSHAIDSWPSDESRLILSAKDAFKINAKDRSVASAAPKLLRLLDVCSGRVFVDLASLLRFLSVFPPLDDGLGLVRPPKVMEDSNLSNDGKNKSTCFPTSVLVAAEPSSFSQPSFSNENDGFAVQDASIPTINDPSLRMLLSRLFNADDANAHRIGTNGTKHVK
jgi:hypothetical protein